MLASNDQISNDQITNDQITDAAVFAEDLVKVYPGGVRAVDGVSFTIDRGEAFGLLGPNGAGKSTTIGMLNTTVTPTSGRAFIAGLDVTVQPVATRSVCSVVFQDPALDGALSGRQNLNLHLRLWRVPKEAGARRVSELSELVGLAGIIDRPVSTYSGGQRRRLEIVRALASEPQVLFLDEPTAGLDTRVRHDLFDTLGALRDRTGVTIIMTTHYLDEAERLCDRLAVIDSGRVVACDTPQNLLAAVGDQVLEVRVDDSRRAAQVLVGAGIAEHDVTIIGGTVAVSLRGHDSRALIGELERRAGPLRASATRAPNLDDVYLRLTGARMTGES